jgi:hypothetical protein
MQKHALQLGTMLMGAVITAWMENAAMKDIARARKRTSRGNSGRWWRVALMVQAWLVIWVGWLLTTPHPGHAAAFSCAADDVACLIAAISAANANREENTITLAAGTFTLTTVDNDTDGPNGLPSVTSVLTIRGVEAETTVIERASDAPGFRIMHVAAVATLTLEDVTLRHGVAGDVTDPGPIGGRGGGLFNAGGTVTLSRSTLANNGVEFEGEGGGLFTNGGTVTLLHSTVAGNSAEVGAGVFNSGGTVLLMHSAVNGNHVIESNGGGFANDGGMVTLLYSTVAENDASSGSCGGFRNTGTVILTNSTVARNEATNAVGGICNVGTLTITNSTIARNRADFGAGGIENSGTLTLLNSTVAENFVGGEGASRGDPGGLINRGGTVELQNTIVANNSSTPEAEGPPDCAGPVTSQGHNLIGDPTGCTITLQATDLTGAPQFGAFVDPGIPGQGRFPLLAGSPAIDTGNDNACPPTDQLEHPRIDGNGDGAVRCDIGAVEFFPIINELVALVRVTVAFRPRPVPDGPAGTFTITATFTNTSATSIRFPFFEVIELPGGNRLLNADGGAGGIGANLTPDVGDQALAPDESVTVDFLIGLQQRRRFTFFVNPLGAPQP